MQGGSDVCTKTALKRINWASYKISQTTDKVGVFVSIVSTRIPYKGAGKEYIGASAAACGLLPSSLACLILQRWLQQLLGHLHRLHGSDVLARRALQYPGWP